MYSALISQSLTQKQNSFYCLVYIKEFNEKKFNCSNNRYFIERFVLSYYCCKKVFVAQFFIDIVIFSYISYSHYLLLLIDQMDIFRIRNPFKRIMYLKIFVKMFSNQLQAYVQGIKNAYASLIESLSIVMIPLFSKYEKRGICKKLQRMERNPLHQKVIFVILEN